MKVLEGDYRAWKPLPGPSSVTMGVYDGVHLGHQHVLRSLEAFGLPVVVATFRQHPMTIVNPEEAPRLLMTVERRVELLGEYGVAAVAVLDFSEDLRRHSAEAFVERILVDRLRARRIAVGRGFRFGYRQLGDVALLRSLGERHGFAVDDVDILETGVPVRSTVIRALIDEGHVGAAGRMLGRPFRLTGRVVTGRQRSADMGYPTANLSVPDGLLIPGSGVYATRIRWRERKLLGVVNIGNRPTFGGEDSIVEAHVLDFDGDLSGETISVDFVDRLRAEQRFAGVDALVDRIEQDISAAKQMLEGS